MTTTAPPPVPLSSMAWRSEDGVITGETGGKARRPPRISTAFPDHNLPYHYPFTTSPEIHSDHFTSGIMDFPKVPLGSSPPLSEPIGDFLEEPGRESVSSPDSRAGSTSRRPHTSPSLLSCLFSRQSSFGATSSSAQSQGVLTPATPSIPLPTPCGKPILKNSDSTSAGSSASDDGHVKGFHALLPALGLGFSPTMGPTTVEVKSAKEVEEGDKVMKRKSCLTFSVRSPPQHSPAMTSVTSPRSLRSPHSSHASSFRPSTVPHVDLNSALFRPDGDEDEEEECEEDNDNEGEEEEEDQDDEDEQVRERMKRFIPYYDPNRADAESDDEGYQEDEEGGFTSDEDLTNSVFTRRSSQHTDADPQFRFPQPAYTFPARGPVGDHSEYSSALMSASTSTSDDGYSHPLRPGTRGRSISIVDAVKTGQCLERCSRHRSPPPSKSSRSTSSECPPAASSPSAAGLYRRRSSAAAALEGSTPRSLAFCHDDLPRSRGDGGDKSTVRLKGWKSDDAGFSLSQSIRQGRKGSLPTADLLQGQPSKSILQSNAS